MKMLLLAGTLTSVGAFAADMGAVAASGSSAGADEVRLNEVQWGEAWVRRDADVIIGHYGPDALLIVPGVGPVRGQDAFDPFIREVLRNTEFSLTWTVGDVAIAASGDLAYVTGSYVQHNPVAGERKFTEERGSYVTVLRKVDGRWLGVAEINAPGP